jgi:hypothetical protein
MFIKLTKQKLIDYSIIAAMLSFCIGIVSVNFGEYPLLDKVTSANLAATGMYIAIWALFIYLTSVTKRKYAMLFARVFMTVCLLFQVWFVLATASINTFIPAPLARTFSLMTVILNNPFIGLYFFIGMTDGYTYALVSSLIVFALCTFSWMTWLSDIGYFDAVRKRIASRPKKKTRTEKLREDILELRRQKEERKSEDGENGKGGIG